MPAAKIKTRTCRGCGKVETGTTRTMTNDFCSKECWRVNMAGKYLRRGRDFQCAHCGTSFYRRPGVIKHELLFCNMRCRIAFKQAKTVTRVCPTCKNEFTRPQHRGGLIHCSYRCSKLGSSNPRYSEHATGRRRGWSREWRRTVYERDNYTCQACGARGGKLHPHHKDGFHWAKERRADVSNGVTLCVDCHNNFHSLYGRGNNTEAQFSEWIGRLKMAA